MKKGVAVEGTVALGARVPGRFDRRALKVIEGPWERVDVLSPWGVRKGEGGGRRGGNGYLEGWAGKKSPSFVGPPHLQTGW